MADRKTWIWWSGGKDSAWALHHLNRETVHNVCALVTTVDIATQRVAAHGIPVNLVQAQSSALGLPLKIIDMPFPSSNEIYESTVQKLVESAEQEGVTHMAFGDLFLEDIRNYRINLLIQSSIEAVFPLWHFDTSEMANRIIESGTRARVISVSRKFLDPSFLGRKYDKALLAELPGSVDPCGENGEFHTFVNRAPGFSNSVEIQFSGMSERSDILYSDVCIIA